MADVRGDGTAPGTAGESNRDSGDVGFFRRLLLGLMLLGSVGLLAELVLLEHTEDTLQWVPLVLLAAVLLLTLVVMLKPSSALIRAFQAVMAACVVAGAVGFYLHMRGNFEFELESDPSLRGAKLVWEALKGATPSLAPGALAQLGLLGLVAAHRHPALRRRSP